jgi:hypothetical protein
VDATPQRRETHLKNMKKRRRMVLAEYRELGRKYWWHPLYQDEWNFHPDSLACLSSFPFDGVATAYFYLKYGFKWFNAHIEQLLLPFVHHQVEGESYWVLVPYDQLDRFVNVIEEIV